MSEKFNELIQLLKTPEYGVASQFDLKKREKVIKQASKIKVALVMLVKDQAVIIEKVLHKAKEFNIDEFIIVDTGSSDGTKEILEKLDFIHLKEMEWVEDFSKMRNDAAKFTDADWIFTLDSDEVILESSFDMKLLISIYEELGDGLFSISFEVHTEEHNSFEIPSKIYNPSRMEYYGLVHEELRGKLSHLPVETKVAKVQIVNHGASLTEKKKFSKDERYEKLLMKMIEIEPTNPRWFCLLPVSSIEKFEASGNYKELIIKYLYADKTINLEKDNINFGNYTRMLFQKLIVHMMIFENKDSAYKIA
ncbi:MAG: glycosyltransferase, partial [Streptococcaceae bacterium]|nr:glycosyltransferase [Streptococcaceae bacterium]